VGLPFWEGRFFALCPADCNLFKLRKRDIAVKMYCLETSSAYFHYRGAWPCDPAIPERFQDWPGLGQQLGSFPQSAIPARAFAKTLVINRLIKVNTHLPA
jgi:hypothetical protein